MVKKTKKFKCPICDMDFPSQLKCNEHDDKKHPFISGDDWDEIMGIPPRDRQIEINELQMQVTKLKKQIKKLKNMIKIKRRL